ncbi:MAG: ABC transporter permease [Bacteroidia bacterium]
MKNTSYSQLRAMMAITKASLRAMLRSPSSIVFTIAFPLIFIIVFGFIGGGGMKIDVTAHPDIDIQNPLFRAIANNPSVKLTLDKPLDEAMEDLSKGRIAGVLNIRVVKDVNGKPKYIADVKTSSASADGGNFLKMFLGQIVDKINLQDQPIINPVAELRSKEIQGRKFKMIDFILPGQLGFSLLSTGVFGTAFVFLGLRNTLVIKRFFATPINRMYIILGETLSRMIFALLGALIIIILGRYVFGYTLIHGVWTVLQMLFLAALGLVVFMGFGFTISGIAKTESTVPPLANIVTLPQFILSGTFFSVEVFPVWLQYVSKIMPLTYLNNALRKVAFEGASLIDVRIDIMILAIWGIVIYIIAAKVFKWE